MTVPPAKKATKKRAAKKAPAKRKAVKKAPAKRKAAKKTVKRKAAKKKAPPSARQPRRLPPSARRRRRPSSARRRRRRLRPSARQPRRRLRPSGRRPRSAPRRRLRPSVPCVARRASAQRRRNSFAFIVSKKGPGNRVLSRAGARSGEASTRGCRCGRTPSPAQARPGARRHALVRSFRRRTRTLIVGPVIDAHRRTPLAAMREQRLDLAIDVAVDVLDVVDPARFEAQQCRRPVRCDTLFGEEVRIARATMPDVTSKPAW